MNSVRDDRSGALAEADAQAVLDEVCMVLETISAASPAVPGESKAERRTRLHEMAENFVTATLALRPGAAAPGAPGFTTAHLDMLWALFSVLRDAEVFDPHAAPRSAVIAAFTQKRDRLTT